MSREPYNSVPAANSGARSPGARAANRRITELPTVDRSPSREYASRGSPLGKPHLIHFINYTLIFPFKSVEINDNDEPKKNNNIKIERKS